MTSAKYIRTTRDVDRIAAEKGKRGEFSPRQSDHCHNYYELIYLSSGQCRFLLNDSVYRLAKGDLIFVAPGDLHHASYETAACEIMAVYFTREFVDWDMLRKMLPPSCSDDLCSFTGCIPPLYQGELVSLLNRMLAETSGVDACSGGLMHCYLHELLLLLMRHCVMSGEEPDFIRSKDAAILAAAKYIYRNYQKPLSLEEVAAQAALSPTYFSRKFKQVTGMGFKEYLNVVRLKHARTALLTTSGSITDIALENGFNDSNYFKDLFKRVHGKSPRAYRRDAGKSQKS